MPRKLEVEIVGDVADLSRAYNEAGTKTESLGSKFGGLAKTAALGAGAAGVGALVLALKSSVDAAREAEVAQAQMVSALDTVGISYQAHADVIDRAIQSTSKLAAIDDEELQGAFTKLVRSTGDLKGSLEGMALAADIARARHISLEAATKMVEKGMLGQETAFKRVGLVLDDNATKAEIMAAAQQRFAGAAEAYGNTAAGAQEKLGIAVENLQEKIGAKLLPVVAALTEKLVDLVAWAEANGPAFQEAIQPGVDAIRQAFDLMRNAIDKLMPLIKFDLKVAITALKVQMEIWKTAINLVEGAIKLLDGALTALKPAMTTVKNVGETVADFFSGAFKTAFNAGKAAVSAVDTAIDGVRAAMNATRPVASLLAGLIEGPFKVAFNAGKTAVAAVDAALDGVKAAMNAARTAGRAIADFLEGAWDKAWGAASGPVSTVAGALSGITGVLERIISLARAAADAIRDIPTPHLPDIPFIGGGKAGGGPVAAGVPYVVGEHGAELFVPGTSGTIIPNGAAGGGTIVFNFNGHVWDKRDLIEEVRGALVRTRLTLGASGV